MAFKPAISGPNGTFRSQTWTSTARPIKGYGKDAYIVAEVKFDDDCNNGHNSFAITAHVARPGARDWEACGCLHDDIAKVFPELAHLIKWHLVSTDEPMHYVANVTYHAGDRDCWGLRKGERRQIVNGRTKLLAWELEGLVDGVEVPLRDIPRTLDSDVAPAAPEIRYVPWCRVGEGKERNLDAARSVAVWPEATDEQLCLPKEELTKLLEARLPKLLDAFRADVEAFGFKWSST